jgi:hypothetical protein
MKTGASRSIGELNLRFICFSCPARLYKARLLVVENGFSRVVPLS